MAKQRAFGPKATQRSFFPVSGALQCVVRAVATAGGHPIAVGGCVRDHLLGIAPKDVDIEVYGLPVPALKQALQPVATVNEVGKSFGILKVTTVGETFDVSLPRTESKTGAGHRGFAVTPDPALDFARACQRRDFTINAMGLDLATGRLLDPCGGREDLARGVLRHVSPAFAEDPLRVLRGAQFVARFDARMHEDTVALCRSLQGELATLSAERIGGELNKLLAAPKPSKGLSALHDCGALVLFPELAALQNCPQDPKWHPEGDVWVHTLMVTDAAARLVRAHTLEPEESRLVMLGALCHDLGKPATTAREGDHIRSKGHDVAGAKPTRQFLKRLAITGRRADAVVALVREHLRPMQLYLEREHVSDGAIRRLARRVPIQRLCYVAEADFLGRTTPEAQNGRDPSCAWLREQARRLDVDLRPPDPLLQGRHLLKLGHKPGPELG
ncbi:MAG: HD domain-containing protein, partial [Myxococcota bacterium]